MSNEEAFVSSNPNGRNTCRSGLLEYQFGHKQGNFTVNLIVLELLDIPLVLGNGWLCAHKGVIYATQWKIFLTAPSGKRIEYQGGPLLPKEAYPC